MEVALSYFDHTEKFKECKHTTWYFSIVERALRLRRVKFPRNHPDFQYFESHHILPRSIYPEFASIKEFPWNQVLLTPKEHFICHLLLTKAFKSTQHVRKMQHALKMFKVTSVNHDQNRRFSSGQYQMMKIAAINANIGVKRTAPNKGKKMSEEQKAKLRGKPRSDEHRRKLSESHKGKVTWNRGIPHSQKTKDKIAKTRSERVHVYKEKGIYAKSAEHRAKIGTAVSRFRQQHADIT